MTRIRVSLTFIVKPKRDSLSWWLLYRLQQWNWWGSQPSHTIYIRGLSLEGRFSKTLQIPRTDPFFIVCPSAHGTSISLSDRHPHLFFAGLLVIISSHFKWLITKKIIYITSLGVETVLSSDHNILICLMNGNWSWFTFFGRFCLSFFKCFFSDEFYKLIVVS